MHCFINLCRCCLSTDIPQTKIKNEYFCKKEWDDCNTTNYLKLILVIYSDLQLKRTLPCILCIDCQRLLQEATKMKHYLDFQMEDKQSQQLLMEESVCSGCTQFCSSLCDKINIINLLDVNNKPSINVLKEAFPYYQFQSQISYKYCESCNNNVKSVYLLKEQLSVNNDLYEKYCSMLIGCSERVIFSTLLIVLENNAVIVDCNECTETDMFIKEEISTESESIEIKVENYYDFDNNLSKDTGGDYEIEQQQIYIKIESSKTEQKPYKCKTCLKAFADTSHLNAHERIHTGEKPYKCNVCLKAFSTNGNLKIHEQIHTGIKKHKCNICGKAFNQYTNLETHQKIHTGEKSYKCNICSSKFSTSSNLKRHKHIHTGPKPYKCNMCSKVYTESSNLKIHKRIHTGEKPYQCNICLKAFSSSSSLNLHKYNHTGEKAYKCNVCPKAFSTSNYLSKHQRIHTGAKPYECNVCPKALTTKGNLNTHKLSHNCEEPYECNTYSKAFSTSDDLISNNVSSDIQGDYKIEHVQMSVKIEMSHEECKSENSVFETHQMISTEEATYKCNYCPKAFSDSTELSEHVLNHNAEKRYKCDVCLKSFNRTNSLNVHKRSHTGEKPYKCNLCPKAFSIKSTLVVHERIHTGEKPYKCNVCSKAFCSSSSLMKHKRNHDN